MYSSKGCVKSKFDRSTLSLPVSSPKHENNTKIIKARKAETTNSKAIWRTPRTTTGGNDFLTKGVRLQRSKTTEFSYDLSQDELRFARKFTGPMKDLSIKERELQKTGARTEYLNTRYEYTPEQKYNFPEATSWRIGWFHNQKDQK